jgi:hypothetical protein
VSGPGDDDLELVEIVFSSAAQVAAFVASEGGWMADDDGELVALGSTPAGELEARGVTAAGTLVRWPIEL